MLVCLPWLKDSLAGGVREWEVKEGWRGGVWFEGVIERRRVCVCSLSASLLAYRLVGLTK
jgi:hypothetical protein